jgi:hypothetical protein
MQMFWILLIAIVLINFYFYTHHGKISRQKVANILNDKSMVADILELVRNHTDTKQILTLLRNKYLLNTKEATAVLKGIKER